METMDSPKIYIEPLGITRGLTASADNFRTLQNSKTYYSTLKIIFKRENNIEEEIIPVHMLKDFLSAQSVDDKKVILSLLENLGRARVPLELKGRLTINFEQPIIQGVLNVTPDSFSDDGVFDDFSAAIDRSERMIENGAMIIDVGGESTKPGAKAVSHEEELNRVIPVIEKLAYKNIPISIDSRNSQVMQSALNAGAHIINDVSALEHDVLSVEVAKEADVPIILMHAQGPPETMQENPEYKCVHLDIYDYLEERINFCVKNGIAKEKIIIDPGIGFGKTVDHNLQILNHIALFHSLGVPILIGVSRKSFIGKISGEETASNRVHGSISAAQYCLDRGIQIIRVHDVKETKQAISIWNNIVSI